MKTLRGLLLVLAAVPVAAEGCGGSEPTFATSGDASAGTSGAAGKDSGGKGGAGGIGGNSGSSSGGAGGSAGSSAGAGGSGGAAGAAGADGGKSCTTKAECDDGVACNGAEDCVAGRCEGGTPLANGAPCVQVVDGGTIGDGGGGMVCHERACTKACAADVDCDDGDPCTGNEICLPTAKVCIQGSPLNCSDSSACTADLCEPGRGCSNPLIDGDKDGHADRALGACGDDCNDGDPDVYTGNGELCDGKDNDCDGMRDETAPLWYKDCDGDTYAPAGALSVQQCTKPPADASCGAAGGDWTTRQPMDQASRDCWDFHPNAKPGQTTWQREIIATSQGSPPFEEDWDCDGVEERRYPNVGSSSTGCGYGPPGCSLCVCSGSGTGWSGSVPPCGTARLYYSCSIAAFCQNSSATRTQECL